jgi:dihydroorotate dehydrogenase (fumarate)
MIDLSTAYLGLSLKNPVVVSASPLQKELDLVRQMEDAGAAAVVMHSLFEEQIDVESEDLNRWLEHGSESFAEALRYLPDLENYNHGPDAYLEHLARVKSRVSIPIIASLNGNSIGGWTRYASMMEQAGADAIELNAYHVAADPEISGSEVEQMYVDLVQQVKKAVRVPLAVKVNHFFSSIPHMMRRLDSAGADGLVLFNRFYQPDLDLEALEVVPHLQLSHSYELLLRLTWVAVLYGHIKADMAVTGGVHTGEDVLKSMMVGARVAMTTSALLEKGIGHIREILRGVRHWMEDHEYASIRQMQGSMSRQAVPDPAAYERANYMRVLSSYAAKKTHAH